MKNLKVMCFIHLTTLYKQNFLLYLVLWKNLTFLQPFLILFIYILLWATDIKKQEILKSHKILLEGKSSNFSYNFLNIYFFINYYELFYEIKFLKNWKIFSLFHVCGAVC